VLKHLVPHWKYPFWRVHFTATGNEGNFNAEVQGGAAFSASLFIDDQQLASWPRRACIAAVNSDRSNYNAGSKHVFIVVQDHMGLEQNYEPGGDLHKVSYDSALSFLLHRTEELQIPRGVLNYHFSGSNGTSVDWKVTGNLGGEHVSYSSN